MIKRLYNANFYYPAVNDLLSNDNNLYVTAKDCGSQSNDDEVRDGDSPALLHESVYGFGSVE